MDALYKCRLVLLAVSGLMVLVHADQDSCIGEHGLGEVLDVVHHQRSQGWRLTGKPVDISIRVKTPYQPIGNWRIESSKLLGGRKRITNEYEVPERGNGNIRAETKSEGPNVYFFHLHFDTYDPLLDIAFYLHLQHPCNEITIWGHMYQWSAINGTDLPTVLAVLRPVVNMTTADNGKMAFGLKAASGFEIDHYQSAIKRIRENDMLRERERVRDAHYKPIHLGFEPSLRRGPKPKVEAKLVITKGPQTLGDIQSMTNEFQYTLGASRFTIRMGIQTQILLSGTFDVPAVMVSPSQRYTHLIRLVNEERTEFYDTDGTRLLPYIRVKDSPLPNIVFKCLSEGGEFTPTVSAHRIGGTPGDQILQPVSSRRAFGIASSEYEVQGLQLGRKYDFKCRAAVGNMVKDVPFRIVVTQAVIVTTPNVDDRIRVNAETFTNGFRFTCRADGSPNATIKFFQLGPGFVSYPPRPNRIMTYKQPMQPGGRFRIEVQGNESSLVITPGNNPFPSDDFMQRIACVGSDQFTADAAYVDFRQP